MSKSMDEKTRKDIALFRFGLIAPVINGNVTAQMKYFRQLAQKEHNVPLWGKRFYKESVFSACLKVSTAITVPYSPPIIFNWPAPAWASP
jgi:hypothetical protein